MIACHVRLLRLRITNTMKTLIPLLALCMCLTSCQTRGPMSFINPLLDEWVPRDFPGGPVDLVRVTAIGSVRLQGDGVKYNPAINSWTYDWLRYTGGSPWTGSGTMTIGKVP